ncbi:hypothetical protein MRS44_009489 [Fusarium solani]|uniref:uncharacterized protein n=1 Tax=Fusarium solani TaxID=169388 RepID=UPI0032C4A70D|nr:hypothetical protein MRS44_009489 [Fusarium solani]
MVDIPQPPLLLHDMDDSRPLPYSPANPPPRLSRNTNSPLSNTVVTHASVRCRGSQPRRLHQTWRPCITPPRDARILARQVALVVFNLALVTGVEGASSLGFSYVFKDNDFKTTSTLPLPWQLAKHIVLLLTAREVLTYYIHRYTLHSSSTIGKYHRRFAHARAAAPYSLLLFADHPIPLLLQRFVPIYLPALALRPHLLTYFLFLSLCTAEETLSLSGYSIVPGIIMGGMTRRTAVHYASGGDCNYGAWGFLDWVNGTGRGRDVLEDVKAEAEKHHVKERSAKKVDSGMGAIQDGIDKLTNGNEDGRRRSSRLRSKRAS